jgi:hypothetical protein
MRTDSISIKSQGSAALTDIYGVARQPSAEIGAVEFFIRPNPPGDIKANIIN